MTASLKTAVLRNGALKNGALKTVAVLTISDSSFLGTREDASGPAVVHELEAAGFTIVHRSILPDERDKITARLIECCEIVRLVVTTGGTGIAARDVTPEATLAVLERRVEGIEQKMRQEGGKKTPFAVLSRGVCGIRGKSLLLNVPGSPAAAVDSLQAVIGILPHALELLEGNTEH